ncbi:MAG: sorbosone dehydrogenase family protein [Phycisphaerales bacterium]|nr:sorbosone dehydrogenase family protein [Phycisphaerales bacterium]
MTRTTLWRTTRHHARLTLLSTLCAAGTGLSSQHAKKPEPPKPAGSTQIITHVARPERRDATQSLINSLELPDGFRATVFADGLKGARMMAVGPDGSIYLTRREAGEVVRLRDHDGDGHAEEREVMASGLKHVHGITIYDGELYVATVKEVMRAPLAPGKGKPDWETLIDDLPDGGQHPNRTLAFGPDGQLYITVGSTCNACPEPNPECATLLVAKPDGSQRRIFAKGLRNTIGFGWHPETGELWGADHGIDFLGDDIPPEELNLLKDGKDYGWPYSWGNKHVNPAVQDPPNGTKEAHAAASEPPMLEFTAHSAPIAMVFCGTTADNTTRGPAAPLGFPADCRGDAFVAMHGSWNRTPPDGYEVLRIRFEGGKPVKSEPFLSGFLTENGKAQFGRPAGLVFAADGSLLVSDDENGVVYRVSHEGR